MQKLTIFNCQVHSDGDMVSFTDTWQIAKSHGYAEGKFEPKKWGHKPYANKSGYSGFYPFSFVGF